MSTKPKKTFKNTVGMGLKPILEDILKFTVEEGECRLWTGPVMQGRPIYNSTTWPSKSVRRTVHQLRTGKEIPSGVRVSPKCGNPLCLEHLWERTPAQVLADTAKRGLIYTPVWRAACTRAVRGFAHTKLDADKAAEILASDEPTEVLRERYGCSRTAITDVRSLRSWRPTAGTSIFNLR